MVCKKETDVGHVAVGISLSGCIRTAHRNRCQVLELDKSRFIQNRDNPTIASNLLRCKEVPMATTKRFREFL